MKKALLVLTLLLVVGGSMLAFLKPEWLGLPNWDVEVAEAPASPELLETMRTALAETENLNPDAAEPLWMETLSSRPNNTDALQNLIVTRISRLDQLRAKLNDASVDPEEKSAIEATFPAYEDDARSTIESLRTAATAEKNSKLLVAAEWFSGRLDSVTAGSNITPEVRTKLSDTIEKASQALAANPEAVPLVGLIEELTQLTSDPIEGLSAAAAAQLLPAFDAAVNANPRNLFLTSTALSFAITAKDPKAADYALRLQELSEPIVELIRRDAGSLDVATFGQQIADFVKADDWRRAQGLQRPWMNLLRGTEMMKVDRKKANPNVLDFVATASISKMATELAAELAMPTATSPLVFADQVTLETGLDFPVAITKVDFDLLDAPEIAVASDDGLVVLKQSEGTWEVLAKRTVNPGVRGMVQAELFPADASDPLRIKRPTPSVDNPDSLQQLELANLAKSHNTYPGLILWGRSGVQLIRFDGRPEAEPDQRLLESPRETGLEMLRDVLAVQVADIDADGDLDLIVSAEESGLSLWVNRGDLTFFSVTQFSELPPADDPVVAMAIGDLDRDLDIDVATMQASGRAGWLENLLHLQMRWQPLAGTVDIAEEPARGTGIAVVEWDGNVSWDVAYSSTDKLALLTTETTGIGVTQVLENRLRPLQLAQREDGEGSDGGGGQFNQSPAGGQLLVADLDNDSWPDLLTYGRSGITVIRGGAEPFEQLEEVTILQTPVEHLAIADLNLDGKQDLLFIANDQTFAMLIVSDTGHYINVQMKGIDDNATGRVNHFAIGSTLELRFGPHYRAHTINDRTTHFGLGALESADTLRAILTNGITQNIINPPIDTTVIEEQTLKGSCPYLYTWDGEKFVFVTDCLWAAPLGLQYAVGKVIPDRPWEYLKVDGKFLKSRDGMYEIRLTEELWELAYFDHVSLIAVDHPADVEIWTNEKVGPPDAVQPKIFTVSETRKIEKATSSLGEDCTELLRNADEAYVQGFEGRYRQGLCPVHWVELELGEIQEHDRVLLLMTGWILPTDTSLNIQIDQNPDLPPVQAPSVWIPSENNDWVCSIPAMGFPGGKTKTIVVDLTGKINLSDTKIRIQTSAQIYWDAAEVAINPPDANIVSTPLEMVSASVSYRGFSAQLPRTSTQPHRYDYNKISTSPKWPPLAGELTRPGDCINLLTAWDDEMVVIGGGDEIQISFREPDSEIPEGWKRDFILHSVGWDKDADLNTLEGQNVGPLPFKAMQAYPPPSSQYEASEEVEAKNRWHRTRTQSFRAFWNKTE